MGRSRTAPREPDEEDARVSLHPLKFEEALEALMATPPAEKEGEDDGDDA